MGRRAPPALGTMLGRGVSHKPPRMEQIRERILKGGEPQNMRGYGGRGSPGPFTTGGVPNLPPPNQLWGSEEV